MDLKDAQVLITGGSDGIGRGLATRFLSQGSKVMITGRNADKLEETKSLLPDIETFVNDIGKSEDRESLAQHIKQLMPGLNILINNAGIQRRVPLALDQATWSERENEIQVLLCGPVHLNHLLIPLLLDNKKESLIVNVTSGGAYIPQGFAPIYSASKAALHSYTVTLRDSLSETNCRVVELIPPAVQTSLAGPGNSHGANLEEFCDTVFNELQLTGVSDIGFGPTRSIRPELSGQPVSDLFANSNNRFPVAKYKKAQ